MADRARVARWFVPVLIGLSVAVFLIWRRSSTPGPEPRSPDAKSPETAKGNPSTSRTQPRAAATPTFEVSQVTASPFQNTSNDVAFVGNAACSQCHQAETESYQQTTHSNAFAEVDIQTEPADGEFLHVATGKTYRVYRRDNQLRHSESLRRDGEEIVLADHAMKYVIGSGTHGRTYLFEDQGFLAQSPVTWYASINKWAMSPGYDKADHDAFERPVPPSCLSCHTGRTESLAGAYHRVRVHEAVISCERCHGAGGLHVKQKEDDRTSPDLTIVNPAHLSRERSEAVCAQCHLQNSSSADVRGHALTEYRPGLRLADFRIHYVLKKDAKAMTVVGHIEQMHLSKCYEQSETFTCTTCHNPHETPSADERISYFRSKCLSCHEEQACGLEVDSPPRREKQDSCIACHMPGSETEIPHVASTHHRVGLHPLAESTAKKDDFGSLEPLADVSNLLQIDRDRCQGLSYQQLSRNVRTPREYQEYRSRAQILLESVRRRGLRDWAVDIALAELLQSERPTEAVQLARGALRDPKLPAIAQVNALSALSMSQIRLGNPGKAIEPLETLVKTVRNPNAWVQLGVCRQQAGDLPGAITAVETAVAISPHRADMHLLLADLYAKSGSLDLETKHRRLAEVLKKTP